jgi:hypothetical protein
MVPRPLDFVYAKNSAVVPVPTLNVAEVAPEVEVTGVSREFRLERMKAFCAVTATDVPATIPLSENLSASPASILLSEGTLTTAGVEATFAVVIVTPFTDRATTGLANADVLTKNVEKTPMLSSNAVIFLLCMVTFFLDS